VRVAAVHDARAAAERPPRQAALKVASRDELVLIAGTDRAYRKALSHEVALTELTANAGTQFDPDVVEALTEVIEPAAESVPIRVDDNVPALPSPSIVVPYQAAELSALDAQLKPDRSAAVALHTPGG
jgi:hypothetical protein